ncbi:MAG: winged helix-turn-helix domain-containing protein [Syntrophomonas sp.]
MVIENNPVKTNTSTSDSVTFTDDEVRNAFLRWLTDGHAKEYSPDRSITCMEKVSEYAVHKKIITISLWSTNHRLFSDIYNKILVNKLFRVTDKKTHAAFTKVGRLYLQFLKEKAYAKAPAQNDDSAMEIQEDNKNSTASNEKTLTIVEAAVEVLRRCGSPLSSKRIYEEIVRAGLYSFKAQKPINVVNYTIRSHCDGIEMPALGNTYKVFAISMDESGKAVYSLLEDHRNEKEKAIKGAIFWSGTISESFSRWLAANNYAASTSRNYISAMDRIVKVYSDKISGAITTEGGAASLYAVEKLQKALSEDRGFIQANETAHNQLTAALNAFKKYLSSGSNTPFDDPLREIPAERVVASADEQSIRCVDFIKSKNLDGATTDEIAHFLQESRSKTIKMLDQMPDIIECTKGTYVHSDSFVDLEEARETMLKILRGHFSRFYGFSSSKILYEAARVQLDIFMNDNDLDDEMKLYYLARYFFSKIGSEKFTFYSNWQIWENEPEEPKSTQGLLMRLAKRNGGILSKTEAENLLGQLRLIINLTQTLGLYQTPRVFWQFSETEYLYAPSAGMNKDRISAIEFSLRRLFCDNPEEHFIILRDISDEWMTMLPALPMGKPWTPLLLQETIGLHPEMGFKTIKAEISQSLNTVHAAIIQKESHIVTFSDVVWEYLYKGYQLPHEFAAEELRLILREAGMLEGNELIYNMHKALNDYRFAWKNNNAHVRVLAI